MKDTLPYRVRLGVFEVDLRAGELRQADGSVLLLPNQSLQVLRMLVEAKGDLVTRDKIQQTLWPNDTVVEFDHSINTAIKKLRRALGDTGEEPQYIGTIAKRGYRLLVPVEKVSGSDDSSGSIPSVSPQTAERRGHTSDAVVYSSLIGKKVSHYRVLSVIGGGGMGMVYEAEDLKLGRRVALKFLPEELASDPVALQRFEREAHTASSLNHPNICTIHEVEDYEGRSCIVMELLQGQTLRDWLASAHAEQKALLIKQILDVAMQVADGLQAAHEKGIVHRDIKPANIFLTTSGQVKILDFGVAKLLEGGEEEEVAAQPETPSIAQPSASGASHLTRTGVAMGTAAYMSPEQVRGDKLDARTDLFSFGLVLYEMATGRRAFGGQTAAILHDAILKETPVPVHELNPTLPPELEQVINKSLEKDRDLRYQSAAEMGAGLQGLKRDSESGRRSAAGWDTLRHLQAPTAQTQRLLRIVLPILLVAALIGGGLYYRSRQAKRLTEKDTVVLADFDNKTGDAVFDDALNTALRIQLEQTPFLNVLSDRKVAKTLQLMTRPADTKLTPEVARELCQRAGSKAYIAGAIGSLGSEYVLGLKAVNCQSADLLAQEQVTAATKEKVLEMLGKAATRLRGELGESMATVQKFDVPLEEATTSSLEALKAVSIGNKVGTEKGDAASIPFYKRAIELDPNFPLAYAALASAYYNLVQPSLALEYATKAYQLRDRVSEREQLRISAMYFGVTGEVDKEAQTYERLIANYPGIVYARMDLGNTYVNIGQYDKALAEYQEALPLMPDNFFAYASLGYVYFALNRLQEAQATFDQALAHKLDGGDLRQNMYLLAFLRGDAAQMEQQVAWGVGKPGDEDPLLSMQSDTEAYYGRLSKARDFSRRAVDSAVHAVSKETAAGWQINAALREAELGNTVSAGQGVTAALALSPGRDVKVVAALTLARIGDAPRAKALAEELAKSYPTNTLLKLYWLPLINAAIELSKGNSSQAVVLLEAAAPYELGQAESFINFLYPAYVRGQAYLLAHNGAAAAAEFQKILDHSGFMENFVTGSLAHLQIGRAYAMAGDTAKATAAYQDFLNLWKDADPDIPIYKQAKAEYAKLH